MIRDILLSAGIVLAPAGQLSTGLPAGFAEALLFGFVALSFARMLWDGRIEMTDAFIRLGTFWLIFFVTLALGFCISFFIARIQILGFVLHDGMAFSLMMAMCLMMTARRDAAIHMRRSAWLIVGFANVTLALQVATGWGLLGQPGVGPWLGDRFQGWSENPNQLALYCAAYGPLALYLATTSRSPRAVLLACAAAILPFYVGRLTKSDSFLLASVVGYLSFGLLMLGSWLGARVRRPGMPRQLVLLALAGAVALGASLAPQIAARSPGIEALAEGMSRGGGGEKTEETAQLRLYLWKAAAHTGLSSASLGQGPGPHLERPPVSYRQTLPELFEAHNTILDLFTQGGLIAVLNLAWIVTTAVLVAWRARLDALVALVLSLAVFGLTHLIVRHPVVWFSVAACLLAGRPRSVAPTTCGRAAP